MSLNPEAQIQIELSKELKNKIQYIALKEQGMKNTNNWIRTNFIQAVAKFEREEGTITKKRLVREGILK